MKPKLFILSSCLILVIGIITVAIYVFSFSDQKSQVKVDYTFLQNGDLVLRKGRSVESMAVSLSDKNSDFSHIGIVVVENSVPYIIHVVPDQPDVVRKELPEVFLDPGKASRYKVLRSDFNSDLLNTVAETANDFYNRHLAFDNSYDFSTDSSLYCTELVLKAFEKCKIVFPDIVPQKIRLIVGTYFIIMPGSFLVNSHFTHIKSG